MGGQGHPAPPSDAHDYVFDLVPICSRLRAFVHKWRLLINLGITILGKHTLECMEHFTVFINENRSWNHK